MITEAKLSSGFQGKCKVATFIVIEMSYGL